MYLHFYIYINNINNNDKFDYNQLFNNKNNNIRNGYGPQMNNNKGYIIQSEQMNNFRIFNNNNNYNRFEFKYEPVKRQNDKISYEKFNYNDYLKKNNLDKNYGLNDLYKRPNMRNDNNNINQYNNNGNKNLNKKINKNDKMNQPKVKRGGGRVNELKKKFGFY